MFSNYIAQEDGTILSLHSNRVMTGTPDKDGYIRYKLTDDTGKPRRVGGHRFIAEALIPNPDNLPIVNHIDEDKSNNHPSNLEWCTKQHNSDHSLAHKVCFMYAGNTYCVHSLSAFCRRHELNLGAMGRVKLGKAKSHKGWTLGQI